MGKNDSRGAPRRKSTMREFKTGERIVVINMTDEKKKQWAHACAEVMRVCKAELPNGMEAHAVLKICLQSLEDTFKIIDTQTMPNLTERVQ